MNILKSSALILLGGCAAQGPNAMLHEKTASWFDRYENSDVVCYVAPNDDAHCKWKTAQTPVINDYLRQMIPSDRLYLTEGEP